MRGLIACAILIAFFSHGASAASHRSVKPGEVAAAIHACATPEAVSAFAANPGRYTPFKDPISVGEAKWLMIRTAVLAYMMDDEGIQGVWEYELDNARQFPGAAEDYSLCIYTARLAQVRNKPGH